MKSALHPGRNSSARILEAALSLFSQKGYERTSTRELCDLAGITKPTLYYFFESKEGVYRALVEGAFREHEAILRKALAGEGTAREKIKRVAERMFNQACARPEVIRLLFSLTYSVNSPFVQLVHTSHLTLTAPLRALVAQAAAEGEILPGDVDLRMTVLHGALSQAISKYLIGGTPRPTRRLADAIVDAVFDGWCVAGQAAAS